MQPGETKASGSNWVLHRLAPGAIIGLLVAGYFAVVCVEAWNVPTFDDYGILGFIARVHTGDFTWAEFWAPHNEHRIVWTRVVMLAASYLGGVNFVGLMLIGNLGWLGCGWLLGREAVRRSGSLWAAVPVAVLLAVPSHEENMLWAMASLQNYWVLFFVLAALQLSVRRRDVPAWGMLTAGFLTSGAAVAALPGLLLPSVLGREWRRLALAAGAGLVLVAVYVVGLKTQTELRATGGTHVVRYFANFMGGTVPWAALAPWVGAGLAIALAAVVIRTARDGFCGGVAVFVLVTAALAAGARGGSGVEQALASRYAPYSLLAAVTVWLACLGRIKAVHLRWSGLLLVIGAVLMAGQLIRSGRWDRHRAAIPLEYYKVTSLFPSHSYLNEYLTQARRAGIYQPPALTEITGRVRCRKLTGSLAVPSGSPSRNWIDRYDGIYVRGWANRPGLSTIGQVVWIVFSNEHGVWEAPAWGFDRADLVADNTDGGNYLQSGFEAVLPLFDLPAGRYDLSILVWKDGDWGVTPTPFTYGVGVPRSELKIREE
jgi:hypothetical protein